MSKKLMFLVVVFAVMATTVQVAQAQLITAVAHRNTDADAPEDPVIAPNPLDEGAVTFVDRTHVYADVPEFIIGAEYVMLANDNKNMSSYELDITLAKNAIVYVFVDNRMGGAAGGLDVAPNIDGMPWLTDMGFVDTDIDIGIDESADGSINQYFSIFALEVKAGVVTIGGDTEGHEGNMLGVAVLPSPTSETATNPVPANEATDVLRETVLQWTPGETAVTHDVYFGTVFEDVNLASRGNPLGVLVSQGQSDATYDAGVLDFGTTYYWRVDEVNAPPDSTIFRGEIWSFTTEPYAYPIANIIATSNATSNAGSGPEKTIDGSGLDANDEHSSSAADMWLGLPAGDEPVYIQYEFERVEKLYEMWVWNYNVEFELVLGFGLKDVTIEYSADGVDWTVLKDAELARADAMAGYAHNTVVDLEGVAAKYVRLTVNSNWGMLAQYGLSEVRFLQIPVRAREPEPTDAATDIDPDTALSWRAGREATSHDVYFGTDAADLPLVDSVTEASLMPGALDFGTTYYWRVDEIGDETWAGELWSFATQEYTLIDGFEDYDDDVEAATTIFDSWIDGWVNGNGSTVGYFDAPFAEQTIVRSGGQSMPVQYDNSVSPFYSEATRIFDSSQNWTGNGANTLMVYFQGVPGPFAELASGKIVMGAAGADIWNAADEFRFAYKPLNGNGSVVALVESVSNANAWTKGGVMIRETLDAGSAFAAVYATPGNGCRYQARLASDAAAVSDSSVATDEQIALRAPHWVKIERVGNDFNGYYSTDGENWTAMVWNPQTIAMAPNVYIGLALTSHSAGVLASAEFSGVTTTGNVTGNWAVETIGVEQPEGNAAAPLYVTLEDATGKTATVTHPAGEAAVFLSGWNAWPISYDDLAGVNLSRIEVMTIGVGDSTGPTAGGTGIVYIDDISFGKPAEAE